MKKVYSFLAQITIAVFSIALLPSQASAFTYTATVSGNFSNSITWGGLVPSSLVAGDIILIPVGMTVTMDNNINLNNSATLIVDGTLSSANNTTALIINGGAGLSGSGSISVDSISINMPTGFSFTGNISAQKLTSLAATINTPVTINVGSRLYITGGALNITNGLIALNNNSTIVVNGGFIAMSGSGSVSLSNNYHVLYQGGSSTTGIELTGTGLQSITVDISSGTVTLGAPLTVNGNIIFNSGTLTLNGNDLTLGVSSNFIMNGGGGIHSDLNANITVACQSAFSSSLTFNPGSVVNNLTIDLANASGNIVLGADLIINGLLTLNSGSLSLDGNDLYFTGNGDFSPLGIGSIVSTAASNIFVLTGNTFSGGIRFHSAGMNVNDFTLNVPYTGTTVKLGSDLNVHGTLSLANGLLDIANHNLTVKATGVVSGGSSSSYVVTTNGGTLTMNLIANDQHTFHVGTALNYSPAVIAANSNSVTSDLSVTVENSVLADGYTGTDLTGSAQVVDATWFVSSNATTGLDLNMQLMWSAAMELNGFDRNNAYISHYTGNSWDKTAGTTASTSGSLYTMNRSNITSLSPFTVADNSVALATSNVAANTTEITLYPNPSTEAIHIQTTLKFSSVEIYDVTGRKMKSFSGDEKSFPVSDLIPGMYTIKLNGKDFSESKPFIKAN